MAINVKLSEAWSRMPGATAPSSIALCLNNLMADQQDPVGEYQFG
ncbi:hypothetical protein [Allochromatium palmeri]|nr:hypothetical protein [Allochromatium palmeri]